MSDTTQPSAPTIAVIRQASAKKISERATGVITYRLGVDPSGEIYFAIVHNEGGYFSREWVPLSKIQEALALYRHSQQSFPTRALRYVHTKRSNNNGGFLAALLRHEGLLQAGDPPTLHRCTERWTAWSDLQRHQYRQQQATLAASSATAAQEATAEPDPMTLPTEEHDQDPIADPIEEPDPPPVTTRPEVSTSDPIADPIDTTAQEVATTASPPMTASLFTSTPPPLKTARSRKR